MILDITNFPDGLKKIVREEVERQRRYNVKTYLINNKALFSATGSHKGYDFWENIKWGKLNPYYGVRVVNVKLKNNA